MIRVGIVGLGFMGWIHWLACQKLRGVKVTAVCDRKPRRLTGDWRGLRGNFGPPGTKVDLGGANGYLDWRDLIRDPAIDLVDITLPTAAHSEVAIAALAAGKHVLCEKPMALSAKDCRRMMRAAERAGRMLLVAHVLPFFPEYAWALKAVRSGKYGKVRTAWLKREISEPEWMENYWSAAHVGGPMFDLHVHDAHFLRLLFGMPMSVRAQGQMRDSLPKLWSWQFNYADGELNVGGSCGVRNDAGWTFNHGFEISFEKRQLKFDFIVSNGRPHYVEEPQLYNADGRARLAKLRGSDPVDVFTAELREALRCIRAGTPSEALSPIVAADAIRICQAEASSLARGRSVRL